MMSFKNGETELWKGKYNRASEDFWVHKSSLYGFQLGTNIWCQYYTRIIFPRTLQRGLLSLLWDKSLLYGPNKNFLLLLLLRDENILSSLFMASITRTKCPRHRCSRYCLFLLQCNPYPQVNSCRQQKYTNRSFSTYIC